MRTPKGRLSEKFLRVIYLLTSSTRQNKVINGSEPKKVKVPIGKKVLSIRKIGLEEKLHVGEYNRIIVPLMKDLKYRQNRY